jgi:ribonucleotide reductase alpha subunit
LEFINAKRNNTGETILQSFNISVGINNSKDLAEK